MIVDSVETVVIVGSGYVGLTTACGLAKIGHRVIGYDIDAEKIRRLKAGQCVIHEQGLEELLRENLSARRLSFVSDLSAAIEPGRIVIIAVPTAPLSDGQADVSIVQSVARQIVAQLKNSRRRESGARALIVVKSTVPPGTTDALASEHADAPADFVVNPEFLKEGTALADFLCPDRIVVGVQNEEADRRMRRLYSGLTDPSRPIVTVSRIDAEMVKYSANIMLAGRISLINELANIAQHVGADITNVARGIGHDRRIGFAFLSAGIGYGGSCFPKDLAAIINLARRHGYAPQMLEAIRDVNDRQQQMLAEAVRRRLGPSLVGRTLAIWGLAFKPGTDDTRMAPSLVVISRLATAGARLRVHDAAASHHVRAMFNGELETCPDPYEALRGAEALLICTEWPNFLRPDFQRIRRLLRQPLIFDGRNIYDPLEMGELGFEYHSIGRPSVVPLRPAAASGNGAVSRKRKGRAAECAGAARRATQKAVR